MRLAINLRAFLVSLLLISFTTVSIAAEPTFTKLNKGERAPFQVWCLSLSAAAQLVADKEGEPARCELKISEALERQITEFDLELGSLRADFEYHKEVSTKTIDALKEENNKLEKIALDKPNNYWHLFAGGGFVIGVVSTVLIAQAVK